jgi:MFS family permease
MPKSRISIVLLISAIGCIIFAAARLSNPVENVVGSDPASSIGFVVGMFFNNVCWTLLSVLFADFLMKASRVFSAEAQTRIQKISEFVDRAWWQVAGLNWFFIAYPIAAFLKQDQSDTVLTALLVHLWLMIFSISALLGIVLGAFNTEMQKYIASGSAAEEFHVLYRNTSVLYYIAVYVFNFTIGPSCLVFAGFGYLRRKFTYFLMILLINCQLPSIFLLIMQMRRRKPMSQKSSSKVVATSIRDEV